MLKKVESGLVGTYAFDDYRVDITKDSKGVLSAWLYHKDYGVKEFIFGMCFKPLEDFLPVVERNLPNYIRFYKMNHEN